MVAVDVETREGLHRVAIDKPRLTIGRLPGNDIVLPFTQISRHHAELRQRGQDWWIIDLGSTNGLRVQGRVVREHLLQHGDAVILAPSIVLHFIDAATRAEIVEGSTVPLKVVSASTPLPAPAPPPPAVAAQATDHMPSPARLGAEAAMPLPRKQMGMTAPPSGPALPTAAPPVQPPPATSVPPRTPFSAFATPPESEMSDDWLNDKDDSVKAPAVDLPLSSPFALMRQQGAELPVIPQRPLLYTCPICSERTAPDSPYCWNCHSTIAQPCPTCHLYLLPIQAKCPRCETPNPQSVRK